MVAGDIIAGAILGSFTCLAPSHATGDTVRCTNIERVVHLQGIDAPAMPATCPPGQSCPPGDPFASRDALRALTQGRSLACSAEGVDGEGRLIARCSADGVDLSCAMLAAGAAVPRQSVEACGCAVPQARPAVLSAPETGPERVLLASDVQLPLTIFAPPPAPQGRATWTLRFAGTAVALFLWLAMANLVLLRLAQERWPARRGPGGVLGMVDPAVFLGLAAAGATPAAWASLFGRHAGPQGEALLPSLITITGLQFGLLLGGTWWWMTA